MAEEPLTTSIAELLFTDSRDYLLDPHGTPVKKKALEAYAVVGLFIGPHWLPKIVDHAFSSIAQPHQKLRDEGKSIIFIYVASERDLEFIEAVKNYGNGDDLDVDRPDEESFADVVKKNLGLGWLYIPIDDIGTRSRIQERFKEGICNLSFFSGDGVLHTDQGFFLLNQWGSQAYPFSKDRIGALEQEFKEAKENQNLQVLLVNEDRDYLISSKGGSDVQVNVSDLEGKIVALYFSAHWCPPCQRFTPILASVYDELKQKHADFEVVFISSDNDQESFEKYFLEMPWLAVPFSDLTTRKLLDHWFEVEGIPTLVILDGKGKTVYTDATVLINKYGANAYPFTEEKLEELRQEEEAKREAQTLESLLVSEERDYVLSRFEPVKVGSLVGKTVGLYFSGHWCPPCRQFTPILAAAYDELKGRGEEFEIVFVSSDQDQESFNEYFDEMPWLALPFGDGLQQSLAQYFEIEGIPQLVIIGADGKTVTANARELISLYGADVFPFTDERVVELEKQMAEKDVSLPEETNGDIHHPDDLTTSENNGYDGGPERVGEKGSQNEDSGTKNEYICEGDVCRKV